MSPPDNNKTVLGQGLLKDTHLISCQEKGKKAGFKHVIIVHFYESTPLFWLFCMIHAFFFIRI